MDGDKKHILKDIAYDYIPRQLLDRPKKGFGIPVDYWLRTRLRDMLVDYSSENYISRQAVFSRNVTSFISEYLRNDEMKKYANIVWAYLVFQQWYDCYIEK